MSDTQGQYRVEPRELAVVDAQVAPVVDFTPTQLDILRQTIAAETGDMEFKLFIEVVRRLGLDPFMGQIHAVMRSQRDGDQWVKRMTIQTGIDGYRLLAARTRELAGIDDAEFGPEDDAGHPAWARITVWRFIRGQRIPFTATARWREYVQLGRDKQPTGMWAKMPYNQLAKCAEALALRRGFPAELSGLYTNEEMQQADNPLPTPTARITEERGAPSSGGRSNPPRTTTSPASSAAPAPSQKTAQQWNGLADAPLRQRLNKLNYRTVAQVQKFLADARGYFPNKPDGSREQAIAYLESVERDAERARHSSTPAFDPSDADVYTQSAPTEGEFEPPADDHDDPGPSAPANDDDEFPYDLRHHPKLAGSVTP